MPKPKFIVSALNSLATDFVGDGSQRNVYFVSKKSDVVLIAYDFKVAYNYWLTIAQQSPLVECSLEDRLTGTICSVEPIDDDSDQLVIIDDSGRKKRANTQ